MASDTQRLSPRDRENLVAYLDGELSDQDSRAMALKLTHSVSARREVANLMAVWDWLDALPRVEPAADFTAKTLAVVQGTGPGFDQRLDQAAHWGGQLARGGLACLATVLAVVVGFVVSAWLIPSPTARLASRLSIVENLAEYEAVNGDYEFLRRLDELPEWNSEPN